MTILTTGAKGKVAIKAGGPLAKVAGKAGKSGTARKAAKTGLAFKAAKPLVKSGAAGKAAKTALTLKVAKPAVKSGLAGKVTKRKAKQQFDWVGDATEWVGEAVERVGEAVVALSTVLAAYGPDAAKQLGLVEPPPKPKSSAPWLFTGVAIGAGAAYFLDPKQGSERRKQVAGLIGQ